MSRLQATVVIADELELLLELGAIDDEDTTDDETAELLVRDDEDAADGNGEKKSRWCAHGALLPLRQLLQARLTKGKLRFDLVAAQ